MAGRSNGAWWISMWLFALVVLISVMASPRASAARAGFQISDHVGTQLRELEQVDRPAVVSVDAAKVVTSMPADDDGCGDIFCSCLGCSSCFCPPGETRGVIVRP